MQNDGTMRLSKNLDHMFSRFDRILDVTDAGSANIFRHHLPVLYANAPRGKNVASSSKGLMKRKHIRKRWTVIGQVRHRQTLRIIYKQFRGSSDFFGFESVIGLESVSAVPPCSLDHTQINLLTCGVRWDEFIPSRADYNVRSKTTHRVWAQLNNGLKSRSSPATLRLELAVGNLWALKMQDMKMQHTNNRH